MTLRMLFDRLNELLSQNEYADAETFVRSQPASFETADYSGNLLHYAVSANRGDTVQWLLDHEIDVHARDGRGLTPLMMACERGLVHIAKAIFFSDPSQLDERSSGHFPWTNGRTPMMFVPWGGSLELAEFLLDRGADINARNPNGTTALMIAAGMGRTELVRLLLYRGALLDVCDEDGKNALDEAVEGEDTETVRFLLDNGARIHDKPPDSVMPVLVSAILGENVDMVELLLSHGAQAAPRDKDTGENALELAERMGAPSKIIDILRQVLAQGEKT